MEDQIQHLTRDGFRKFEAELNYLRTVRRSEVAERLRIALEEGGDLVENAEYDDAKNEQAFVEGRIQALEMLLSRASIIEDEAASTGAKSDVIRLSSVVTVQEKDTSRKLSALLGQRKPTPPLGRSVMSHRSAVPCSARRLVKPLPSKRRMVHSLTVLFLSANKRVWE
jgi:transcription elongation factor GreA